MVLAKALLERRDIIVLFARCMMPGLIFQNSHLIRSPTDSSSSLPLLKAYADPHPAKTPLGWFPKKKETRYT